MVTTRAQRRLHTQRDREEEAALRAAGGGVAKQAKRLTQAAHDVGVAIDEAARQQHLTPQLEEAVRMWRVEAARLRHELVVASRLSGSTQRTRLKRVKPHVDNEVTMAQRIVDSAFAGRLQATDPLRDIADQLDALNQAYAEIDAIDHVAPVVSRRCVVAGGAERRPQRVLVVATWRFGT